MSRNTISATTRLRVRVASRSTMNPSMACSAMTSTVTSATPLREARPITAATMPGTTPNRWNASSTNAPPNANSGDALDMIGGRDFGAAPGTAAGILAGLALLDLARFTIYVLVFALIVQAVLSWVSPHAPVAPLFDALTRPFLRPLRRVVPPLANVDLSPLLLIILLQVLLIPLAYLRALVAGAF